MTLETNLNPHHPMNALYAIGILAGILTLVHLAHQLAKKLGYTEQDHRQAQRNAIQRAKREREL